MALLGRNELMIQEQSYNCASASDTTLQNVHK